MLFSEEFGSVVAWWFAREMTTTPRTSRLLYTGVYLSPDCHGFIARIAESTAATGLVKDEPCARSWELARYGARIALGRALKFCGNVVEVRRCAWQRGFSESENSFSEKTGHYDDLPAIGNGGPPEARPLWWLGSSPSYAPPRAHRNNRAMLEMLGYDMYALIAGSAGQAATPSRGPFRVGRFLVTLKGG